MARCILAPLPFCLLAIALTDAARDFSFWGSLRIDCGVSVWSEWGPTNSSGYRNHTRTILRRPQNGGASCPPLTETDWDPWKPDLLRTALRMEMSFVSEITPGQNGYRFKRQSQTIQARDIVFILDTSGSISEGTYSVAKDNLANLIGDLCGTIGPGPADNRAAVITFSTEAVVQFGFDRYLNLADFQRAVRNLPKESRSTCTGKALDLGKKLLELNRGIPSDRQSKKEVMLLTDGKTNCGPNALQAASDLKEISYKPLLFVFAIGQYNDADKRMMEKIASEPTSYHLFHVTNFTEFQVLVDFSTFLKQHENYICTPFEKQSLDRSLHYLINTFGEKVKLERTYMLV